VAEFDQMTLFDLIEETKKPTEPKPAVPSSKAASSAAKKVGMGLGKKLLYGAGVVGNVLLLLDLISSVSDSAQSSQRNMADARAGYGGRVEESLGNLLAGDRLGVSGEAARVAMTKNRSPEISPELTEIIRDSDINELLKARYQPKPSVKEAYARVGLL
tara:strand:+ start:813 stop:1289 length:477 start_codon:yes stop_codon:yes gene_type:complete